MGRDYVYAHDPGEHFVYASWHLYVAAMTGGLDQRGMDLPAHEHVYVPAGLEDVTPSFPDEDCLLPGVACWLTQRHMAHVSGGLRITGRQLSSVLAASRTRSGTTRRLARHAPPFAYGHWIEDGDDNASVVHDDGHVRRLRVGAGRRRGGLVYSWWRVLRRAIILALLLTGATTCALCLTSVN